MISVLRRLAVFAAGTAVVMRPDLAAQVAAPVLLIALLSGFVIREARAWANAPGAEQRPLDRLVLERAMHAVFGPTRLPQQARFTAEASVRRTASRPAGGD